MHQKEFKFKRLTGLLKTDNCLHKLYSCPTGDRNIAGCMRKPNSKEILIAFVKTCRHETFRLTKVDMCYKPKCQPNMFPSAMYFPC